MNISAIVLTKNEERNIEACLQTLAFCNEIIVIDDDSSDKTVALAKKSGATVLTHLLNNNFSQQRNYVLEQAKGEWVLFIDADERVSTALQTEITSVVTQYQYDGYYVKRQDIMWGKLLEHGETGNISLLRLAKKGSGYWEGKVHEQWMIKGKSSRLEHPLKHYPHQTITEFLQEINFYTSLRAKELFDNKVQVTWWEIILYPKGKFIVNYFLKKGFLDGIPGLIIAICMSFHSFLVRGKLWQLWQKK